MKTPETTAAFFKALSHPSRLLILALLKQKSRHGEELAGLLKLSAATVSHHMNLLTEQGLVEARKDQYYQLYSLRMQALSPRVLDLLDFQWEKPVLHTEQEKVLHAFFKEGRLVRFPAQLKKQRMVLEHLVQAFDVGETYNELQVNRILIEFHEDVATLRRSLITEGLMTREGGIYWRVAQGPQSAGP